MIQINKLEKGNIIFFMNISPHLLIDALILGTALTITLVLRAKGNSARKDKESN